MLPVLPDRKRREFSIYSSVSRDILMFSLSVNYHLKRYILELRFFISQLYLVKL